MTPHQFKQQVITTRIQPGQDRRHLVLTPGPHSSLHIDIVVAPTPKEAKRRVQSRRSLKGTVCDDNLAAGLSVALTAEQVYEIASALLFKPDEDIERRFEAIRDTPQPLVRPRSGLANRKAGGD